jgi:hypothetical protein
VGFYEKGAQRAMLRPRWGIGAQKLDTIESTMRMLRAARRRIALLGGYAA